MGRVLLINSVLDVQLVHYVGNTDPPRGNNSGGQTSALIPLGWQQGFLSMKMHHQGFGWARDQGFWHTQHLSASKPHPPPSPRGLVGLGKLDQGKG